MAWLYPLSQTSSNITINLGTVDSIYVASQVAITSTNYAIIGSGPLHVVIVDGTVAATNYGIWLGDQNVGDSGQLVKISASGKVFSATGDGINIFAISSTVENAGEIYGGAVGLQGHAFAESGMSYIKNSGRIGGGTTAIDLTQALQTHTVTNSGEIAGDTNAILGGMGVDLITNDGVMTGALSLGSGADMYDGRSGKVSGTVNGGADGDTIYGGAENNTFLGDAGTDTLYGGMGADTLTGGTEADLFVFNARSESKKAVDGRDTITDFSQADLDQIDVHSIDANTVKSNNQAFKFIGTADFHRTAGELRYEQSEGNTYVYGDADGNGKADFAITLTGLIGVHKSDFML